MARDPIEILFERTDGLDLRVRVLESGEKVYHHRLNVMEQAQAETCRQMISTETKVMECINKLSDKQDSLIRRLDIQDGAKSALKYLPTILNMIVALSTIAVLIRSFK